jgi:hypothetical protein
MTDAFIFLEGIENLKIVITQRDFNEKNAKIAKKITLQSLREPFQ